MIGRTDNDDEEAIKESNSEPVIRLSEYGFNVDSGTITVKDPELEIGKIEGNSLNIDADKQELQEKFMKNMSEKFKKRFNQNL